MSILFTHILGLLAVEYSVLWHDLDLKHQNYLQNNVSIALHQQYVSLILCDGVVHGGGTLNTILYNMARYSNHQWKKCVQIKDTRILPKHMQGPCGQISISHNRPFPLHYDWTIQTWEGLILNITLFEVNVPFENHHCISNFLLLTENTERMNLSKQVAKLCGQSHNKIFYSTKSTITVEVKATSMKLNNMRLVHFQYVAVSHKALSFIALHSESITIGGFSFVSQLLHFISHTRGYIFFYRTAMMLRFVVTVRSANVCDVMIYDGPSSKSPLIKANTDEQGRRQYFSSLHFIAMYSKAIIASQNHVNSCIHISHSQETIKIKRINVSNDTPYTSQIKFHPNSGNVFHKFLFDTSQAYVNIQLQPFEYIGSTEGECYLSGIIFYSVQTYQAYGPFCGELGMNILTEKGLTFGSHTVVMLMYIFVENVDREISFGINVKSEPCAGFINRCDFYKISLSNDNMHMDWFLRVNISKDHFNGFKHYTCEDPKSPTVSKSPVTDKRTIGIEVNNSKPDACYHIQYLSGQDKQCLLEYSASSNVMNVSVSTYYDHYQVNRCHNSSGTALRIYPLYFRPDNCKGELYVKPKKYYEVSISDAQVPHIGLANHFVFWSILNKNDDKTINGGFHIAIHSQKNCSVIDIGNSSPEINILALAQIIHTIIPLVTNKCSITSFNIIKHSYFALYRLSHGLQVTFNIEFENPDVCNSNNRSLMVFVQKQSSLHLYRSIQGYNNIFPKGAVWFVQEKYIKWTGVSRIRDSFVIVSIQQIYNYELKSGSTAADVYGREIECTGPLRVHIRHHTSPAKVHHDSKESSTALTHCVHSRCYYMYKKAHSSWMSAADTCKKHNQQLLTINSDLESNLIWDAIKGNTHLFYSPVLFLNLRRDTKVCIFYFLFC